MVDVLRHISLKFYVNRYLNNDLKQWMPWALFDYVGIILCYDDLCMNKFCVQLIYPNKIDLYFLNFVLIWSTEIV